MISSTRMVCVTIALALFAGALMAQAPGSLKGVVTDPSGAAVPKATVTVSGPNNTVKVAETNDNGEYNIPGLPAGKYTIRIIATGFTLLEKPNVDIAAAKPTQMDAKLVVEVSKAGSDGNRYPASGARSGQERRRAGAEGNRSGHVVR